MVLVAAAWTGVAFAQLKAEYEREMSFSSWTREGRDVRKSASNAPKVQMAWGIAGDEDAVSETIEVRLSDPMRFTPQRIRIRVGQTVRFVMHNESEVAHEVVLGTKTLLDKHAALMRQYPDMKHDEPYIAHIAPGGRGEIIWTFNLPGEFYVADLRPGHYEAGRMGTIDVVD